MISIRINEDAFNPFTNFNFLELDERVFIIDKLSMDNKERILA